MGQSYVSDIIGEDYKNWKPGDRILISTGTGSGKTWFVLRVLLGEAKRQGKHLVYFCNRKFLSLQVQAKAKNILLNELGQDEEGLAEYLHVRTYQRAEKAFDYPNIREICEDGSTGQNTEVRGKDVLYYVFDEAFYFVMDAGFNLDTHHWYDRADITANRQSISVFLAATPEPLLMYLEFKAVKGSSLTELCKRYMARFFLDQGNDVDRWMGFLSPQYRSLMEQRKGVSGNYWQTTEIDRQIKGCIEETKQQSREPALEPFEKVEHAYRSEKELLTCCYGEGRQPEEQYAYLDTHYFDDLVVLARLISDSVRENVRAASEKRNRWLIFVRTREDAMVLKENLRVLNRDAVVITADETQKYGWTPPARRSKRRKVFDALVHGERQACDILISTSVLDSGVSLHAEDVSHLVICQPNKTSFLQMLGRIRVTEGQHVNLYLQSFTPKQMRAYRNTAEQRFQTVVQALLLDEMEPRSLFPFEAGRGERLGMELLNDYVPFFPAKLREELYGNLHRDPNRGNYVYTQQRNAYEKPVRKVNPLAVLNALSEVYYVRRRMPEFGGDPYYFLKEQLSWIGKSYDPTCWIDYTSTRDDMYAYLEQKSRDAVPMDADAQRRFRLECQEKLQTMRKGTREAVETAARFRGDSSQLPGLRKLNRTFISVDLPFQIRSAQSKKRIRDPKTGESAVDNKIYWQVVHLSPEAWEAVKAEERLRGQKQTENREARQKKRQEEEAKMWEEKDRKTRAAGRPVVAVIRDGKRIR